MPRPRTPAEEARNRLAAACHRGDPPETIERLRLELEQLKIDAHVAAIDAAGRAGTLSDAQRERISAWFRYGPAPEAPTAAAG